MISWQVILLTSYPEFFILNTLPGHTFYVDWSSCYTEETGFYTHGNHLRLKLGNLYDTDLVGFHFSHCGIVNE